VLSIGGCVKGCAEEDDGSVAQVSSSFMLRVKGCVDGGAQLHLVASTSEMNRNR
jgi:hypothetical protein